MLGCCGFSLKIDLKCSGSDSISSPGWELWGPKCPWYYKIAVVYPISISEIAQ
jgi:hypothetical protein